MKKYILFYLFSLFSSTLLAQFLFSPPATKKKPKEIPNLSLCFSQKENTYISLGLSNRSENIKGLSINLVTTQCKQKMQGIQISGFANINNQATGLFIGGLCNINAGKSTGISIGGLANINNNKYTGIQCSGLANINNGNSYGINIGGLCNIQSENQSGINISSISNITAGNSTGASLSALSNITAKEHTGVQISGLFNMSIKTTGLQLCGLSNFTQELKGGQIGCFNYTEKESPKGFQIGLVNYAQSNKTKQFGIINLHPKTEYEVFCITSNYSKFTTSFRFRNKHTYTILGIGYQSFHLNSKPSINMTYRIGSYKEINRFILSGDLGFRHIESLNNKSEIIPKRLYAIQLRTNLEYTFYKKTKLIGSIGYNWTRQYNQKSCYEKGLVYSIGLGISLK